MLARVLLAQQQPDRALRLLAWLHTQATGQPRMGSVIELGTLEALARAACGAQTDALTTLAEALALAGPEGYVRVFVDEGASMAHLLGRLTAAQRSGRVALPAAVAPHYLDRLTRAFQPRGTRPTSPTDRDTAGTAGLVAPLSDRELQVLKLLAAGKSNQEIADELVVVLDTAKRHVGHILDKLGAANRTQAVVRARSLGLLR